MSRPARTELAYSKWTYSEGKTRVCDNRESSDNHFYSMFCPCGLTQRFTSLLVCGLAILTTLVCLDVQGQGPPVCYDVYGCFSNEYPFNRTHVPLPEAPAAIFTRFLLFTRRTASRGKWVNSIQDIRNSDFNASRSTVVIIHGFAGFTLKTSITQEADWWGVPMKNQLLIKDDFNVIILDWMRGAWFPFTRAVANARIVGAQGAYFLETLEQLSERRLPFIHIIGFSFGAHVAGYIGQRMKRKGRLIDRITGLDPAAMWFHGQHEDVRLDTSDAFFVDVIHTSGEYGITSGIGHVDFFPNGGKKQPGCNTIFPGLTSYLFCNHKKAPEFFTSSILSQCPLYAYQCRLESDFKSGKCLTCPGSCITMGYHAYEHHNNGSIQGNFYLSTKPEPPFCLYHYQISFKTMDSWFAGLYGPVFVKLKGTNGKSFTMKSMKYIPGCAEITYLFTCPFNLGKLKRITVWHHGIFQSWGLDRVIVRPAWNQYRYITRINKWLRYGTKISKHLLTWEKDKRRQRKIHRRMTEKLRKTRRTG